MFEFPHLDHDQNLINSFFTKGLSTIFHRNMIRDFWETSLTDKHTDKQRETIKSSVELIITADCQWALAKPSFINSFIHLRQDVLTDGRTPEQLCTPFVVQQIISDYATPLCPGEQSGMIQTLNVTQKRSAAPDASLWNSVTKAMWCSWGFGAFNIVVVFLEKIYCGEKNRPRVKKSQIPAEWKEGRKKRNSCEWYNEDFM